jgi:hypothetical protein
MIAVLASCVMACATEGEDAPPLGIEDIQYVPADDADPQQRVAEEPQSLAGCVTIQYCNAPGNAGTICRLASGCSVNNATLQECVDDAYYVCGSPVQPWYLLAPGAPIPQ